MIPLLIVVAIGTAVFFDSDIFRNNGSGNWVDWEDVSTGNYKGDGFEHPNHDKDGEW